MIRCVADTNVLIAGFISPPGSPSAVFLEAHRDGDFELVSSPRLLAELGGVLRRPAFEGQAKDGRADAFVELLAASMLFVDDVFDPPRVTVDRTGDFLVAVARAGGAPWIASSETSLVSSYVRDVAVLTPFEFVTALERADSLRAEAA